jgi:hypothetical protein
MIKVLLFRIAAFLLRIKELRFGFEELLTAFQILSSKP